MSEGYVGDLESESYSEELVTDDEVVIEGGTEVMDLDGDGYVDTIGVDADGDGNYEMMGVDTDGDGFFDTVSADTDGDGYHDTVAFDADGDGYFETVGFDTDGDGELDHYSEGFADDALLDEGYTDSYEPESDTNLELSEIVTF